MLRDVRTPLISRGRGSRISGVPRQKVRDEISGCREAGRPRLTFHEVDLAHYNHSVIVMNRVFRNLCPLSVQCVRAIVRGVVRGEMLH